MPHALAPRAFTRLPRELAPLCLASLCAAAAFAAEPTAIPNDYKRQHQNALDLIEAGQPQQAIEKLSALKKKFPTDAETDFMLAAAYCAVGKVDESLGFVRLAIKNGLPPARFAAGPRELFTALRDTEDFKEIVAASPIVHGPMIGAVTDTSAKIWLRLAVDKPLPVRVTPGEGVTVAAPDRVTGETDAVAVYSVTGLTPETEYRVEFFTMPQVAREAAVQCRLTPPPRPGSPTRFRLAFGGGAGYVPPHERMWTTIAKQKPDLLLLLGDNIYSDKPTSPLMQRYCYYRRQSRPEYRALLATTPVYSIWDDHDFGTNDCWGGPAIDEPAWKRPVWNVFTQNWVNPGYGGGDEQPGCWFSFVRGDIEFFMLDGRYYRTDPRANNPSMLGPVQKKWLLDRLAKSKATFKVLCSPVPWTFLAKGKSLDTWNGYQAERTEIFDHLAEKKIDGVVLMSADRHRSDAWKIPRENGYPLFEFNSSRLTNQHVHGTMKKAIFSYNKKQSFGLVTFDTTADDPTVQYDVVTIDGGVVHTLKLKRSELESE